MFSKSTEYALRAATYIANNANEHKKIGLQEIADAIDSPKSFTAKILQKLTIAKTGIIQSTTGPKGGFYIKKSDLQLPIMIILELMNEKDVIANCVFGLHECSDKNPCPLHNQYKPIKQELMQLFNNNSIKDLAVFLDKMAVLK